jgi:xanthine/CO dehydrogenase XdhC/CoxF family maturation factor
MGVSDVINSLTDKVAENKTTVAAVAAGGLVVAGAALLYKRQQQAVPKEGPYKVGTLPADAYEAVIVGAGPSGSTAAYYIAKEGAKVALLDKATFPRGDGGWESNSLLHVPASNVFIENHDHFCVTKHDCDGGLAQSDAGGADTWLGCC